VTHGLLFALTPELRLGPQPYNPFALVASPKLGLRQRPPPDLVHNEPEFEVEAVLKSRQIRGREREYLVKWKGYHPIEAS